MLDNNLFFILRRLKTWLQSTMKYKFDMIFHIEAAQNMVAEHYMKTILT